MKLFKYLLLLALATAFLTGCEDEPEEVTRPDRGTTQLRIVNASDTYPSIDFYTNYINEETPLALDIAYASAWPPYAYLTIEATDQSEFDNETTRAFYARREVVDAAGDTTAFPLVMENVEGVNREKAYELRMDADTRFTVYFLDSLAQHRFYMTEDPSVDPAGIDSLNAQIRFVNISPLDTVQLFANDTVFTDTTALNPMSHKAGYAQVLGSDSRTLTIRRSNGASVATLTEDLDPLKSYVIVYSQSGAFVYTVEEAN